MPQVTVKKLLQGLVLRFGIPLVMGSNNGLAFIARISQLLTKVLGLSRKLHCAYRPQVERMNQTPKETLTKLTRPTKIGWAPFPLSSYGSQGLLTEFFFFFSIWNSFLADIPLSYLDYKMYTQLKFLTIPFSRPWNWFFSMSPKLWERPSQETELTPHPYQTNDAFNIWVKRQHPKTLVPCGLILCSSPYPQLLRWLRLLPGFVTASSSGRQTLSLVQRIL